MQSHTWSLFLVVSLAAVLTPGPAMLAILGHALDRGTRETLPVVLGNVAGAVVLIGTSVAGLSTLLAALPHGLTLLKIAGAAYLAWLGLRAWGRHGAALTVAGAPSSAAGGAGFSRGVLIALSNPKALLFFGAVLPQFVAPAHPALPQFAVLAATFAALELAVTTGVTLAAQVLAPWLRQGAFARHLQRTGGAVMVAAALLLALAPVRQ